MATAAANAHAASPSADLPALRQKLIRSYNTLQAATAFNAKRVSLTAIIALLLLVLLLVGIPRTYGEVGWWDYLSRVAPFSAPLWLWLAWRGMRHCCRQVAPAPWVDVASGVALGLGGGLPAIALAALMALLELVSVPEPWLSSALITAGMIGYLGMPYAMKVFYRDAGLRGLKQSWGVLGQLIARRHPGFQVRAITSLEWSPLAEHDAAFALSLAYGNRELWLVVLPAPIAVPLRKDGWSPFLSRALYQLVNDNHHPKLLYLPQGMFPGNPVSPLHQVDTEAVLVVGELELLLGQLDLWLSAWRQQVEGQQLGAEAEARAYEALRGLLPAGWELKRQLQLPGGVGEVDLLVRSPEGRLWIVEIKSYSGPVSYRDGALWRGVEPWQGVLEQLRKQADSALVPVILWQPNAKDGFSAPRQLEGRIYHHRGNPQGLASFFQR